MLRRSGPEDLRRFVSNSWRAVQIHPYELLILIGWSPPVTTVEVGHEGTFQEGRWDQLSLC